MQHSHFKDCFLTEEKESVCKEIEKQVKFFARTSSSSEASHFCAVIGGDSILPTTTGIGEEIVAKFVQDPTNQCREMPHYSLFVWTGLRDEDIEGVFTYKQEEFLNITSWHEGEPNGDHVENCAELRLFGAKKGTLNDEECQRVTDCTACSIQEPAMFFLRGMCQETEMDPTYFLLFSREPGAKYTFYGASISKIRWNPGLGKWIIQGLMGNTTKASTRTGHLDYPLGLKNWSIEDGACKGETVELSLTSCNETSFACDNGICIPMENKCDKNFDCEDKSDERDCNIVIIPKSGF